MLARFVTSSHRIIALLTVSPDGVRGSGPYQECARSALNYPGCDRLATLGLQSFVKTSGGKGLHIVAPIQPVAEWNEVKAFAKTIAGTMAKERADRYVATMAKRARGARIFVDYLRNDRGATAVAAYSTRALPRASVSTPLNWEELSPGLRSDLFTVGNVLHRLSSLKRDPWQGFFKIRQRLPQFQHVKRWQRASS